MGAVGFNFTMVHYNQSLTIGEGVQPMCDDKAGSALAGFINRAFDELFGFIVEGTCGFVKQHYVRIAHKRTGDCQALPLATR